MKSIWAKLSLLALLVFAAIHVSSGDPKLLLLQTPTLSKTQIAFVYGGDIWIVSRDGGDAQRLVTGTDLATGPIFSPDGSMVAFSGNYDSNVDVYVVPSTGGEPRRLTYHPGADVAVGWTPDGKSVLFRSPRTSDNDPHHLFTVPVAGGLPTQLPLDMAEDGSYSPDGTHIAYVPIFQWEPDWKGYRGGQTTPVWIANLADSSVVKVPRENSNDGNPMWAGKTVYFLSDREGPRTLFAYDTETQKVARVIDNKGFDITSASAGPGAIVYSQFGVLHLYDLKSHSDREVHVTVSADMPQLLPHWEKVGEHILNGDISPTGARAYLKLMATSSRCPPKRATFATSRTPAARPSASLHGRPTASGFPIFPMRPENTSSMSAIRRAWTRPRSSIWASPRFTTARSGHPTARRLPTPTNS
ncbi:MAG TPA: hypothetical protein VKS44_14825 [Candidatus Acidoferrales bacterium]|nr:hypothetical protein [Candidatus Acidoferrales bacterium]